MQKVALRAQLRTAREEGERWRWKAEQRLGRLDAMSEERAELRERLSLARAGLLIALPHVEAPAARALVAVALEGSEIPGNPE